MPTKAKNSNTTNQNSQTYLRPELTKTWNIKQGNNSNANISSKPSPIPKAGTFGKIIAYAARKKRPRKDTLFTAARSQRAMDYHKVIHHIENLFSRNLAPLLKIPPNKQLSSQKQYLE